MLKIFFEKMLQKNLTFSKDRKIVKYACFFMQICYNIDKGIHNYTCRY